MPLGGTEAPALVVGAENPSWDDVFDGQTAELGDVFRATPWWAADGGSSRAMSAGGRISTASVLRPRTSSSRDRSVVASRRMGAARAGFSSAATTACHPHSQTAPCLGERPPADPRRARNARSAE